MCSLSKAERVGRNKKRPVRSKLGDPILRGNPKGRPNLKKPTALRGAVGVRNRASGDRIKSRSGACCRAVNFLAEVGGLEHNQSGGFTFDGRKGWPK
jgi:hypothetical protein